MKRRLLLASLLSPALAARAQSALAHVDVLLLQPEALLRERVDSEALARYVLALQEAARQALEAQFTRRPNSGFLVVGLRPGQAPRAWLDLDQPLPAPQALALRRALESTGAPEVKDGVVLVTLKTSLWGGRLTARKAPVPPEWRAAAERAGSRLAIEQLAEAAWND